MDSTEDSPREGLEKKSRDGILIMLRDIAIAFIAIAITIAVIKEINTQNEEEKIDEVGNILRDLNNITNISHIQDQLLNDFNLSNCYSVEGIGIVMITIENSTCTMKGLKMNDETFIIQKGVKLRSKDWLFEFVNRTIENQGIPAAEGSHFFMLFYKCSNEGRDILQIFLVDEFGKVY